MKLTNPADEQLSEAFTVCVAQLEGEAKMMLEDSGDLQWTRSADALLPFLEKCNCWSMDFDQGEIEEITVNVWSPHHGQFVGQSSLPRALCIALLRAHGVEVELNK